MKSVMRWLVGDDCPITYDDWSDEYVWSCAMRLDGRYSSQKVPDEVGHAISHHHIVHHDSHPSQVQDWCIGVRKNNRGVLETICSHELEDGPELENDWTVI